MRKASDNTARTGMVSVEDTRSLITQLFDAVNYLTTLRVDHQYINDEKSFVEDCRGSSEGAPFFINLYGNLQ